MKEFAFDYRFQNLFKTLNDGHFSNYVKSCIHAEKNAKSGSSDLASHRSNRISPWRIRHKTRIFSGVPMTHKGDEFTEVVQLALPPRLRPCRRVLGRQSIARRVCIQSWSFAPSWRTRTVARSGQCSTRRVFCTHLVRLRLVLGFGSEKPTLENSSSSGFFQ